MDSFIFDLQRFAEVTISAGGTREFDGVTYKATSNAVLNLDDDGKVSGLASGSVTATITSATDSPTVTFNATNSATNFTATSDGKVISAKMVLPLEIISGEFTFDGSTLSITAGSDLAIIDTKGDYSLRNENHFVYDSTYTFSGATMTSDAQQVNSHFVLSNGTDTRKLDLVQLGKVINNFTERGFTLVKGSSEVMYIGGYTLTATAVNDDAGLNIELGANGITLVPNSNDGALNVALTRGDTEIISGELECISGSITLGYDNAVTFEKDTSFNFTRNGYTLTATTTDKATTAIALTDKGISFTPGENDGGLKLLLRKGNKTIFDGELNVSGGTITFDATTQKFSFTKDTNVSISLGDDNSRQFDFKVVGGNASFKVEADGSGKFKITPDKNDGSLNITFKSDDDSLSANVKVLSGSFTLGGGGSITVGKDTELQIKFSDDYIINFKATDNAGGKISLGSDGITFAPNSKDGGLKLSVTRDGQTRSASLDVTGSVTYKLDGSISLTKGTVVKNVFDDGNILTITANTDASGSMVFNPQTGLTITPTTADAITVSLKTGNLEVVKITSITGSITYSGGIVTASDGTKIHVIYQEGDYATVSTAGGTTSVKFGTDRATYTANKGATLTINYLDDLTNWELKNGTLIGIYNDAAILSKGSIFNGKGEEFIFRLETAGDYIINGINIKTSSDNVEVMPTNYDTIQFAANAGITISATEDNALRFNLVDGGKIKITTAESGNFGISSGSITFDDGKISITKGTTISLTQGERITTFTADKDISAPYKIEEDIYYFTLDDATANVSIAQSGQTVLSGDLEINGVFSYRPETGTYGLTGANSSHGNGKNTSLQFTLKGQNATYAFKTETNDTTVVFIPSYTDGKFEVNFPNKAKHAMKFTVSKDGQTVFENKVAIDGKVGFDTATQELSLAKDTVLTFTQGNNVMTITAVDDAGGKLNIVDGGLRFAPNENDGALELNFVTTGRKANVNVNGAIIFGENNKISLEDGTKVTFDWEDGTVLKLTSTGSTGSIGLDKKGIKITSEDENLSIDLTTNTGDQSHLSGIKGTIYYNTGKVSFDDNSTITATTTLGGEPILITLKTIGGTGHLDFADNGIVYSADTGAMQITWSKDDLESTFTVNSGSVQIGHGLFQIAKGTNLATDLKNFVPALYFTTSEAGTYTINGQKITTTAKNISMTATDDYMTFKTSDDAVKYNGMNFAGAGNVSLTSGGVVLGAGVEATGFGVDKSFILTEAGNVTADARIFELTEDVPTGITVTGAQDGFIFSRTNTEESEARFDTPNPDNIGKIFTEEFFLTNDDSYRIQTDLLGLQQIIGVSAPVTIKGGATFDGEPEETVFDAVTDNEGVFTVGDKTYTISGDDIVAIKTIFNSSVEAARGFDSLSGTVSGDFTAHEVSINGSSSAVQAFGDTDISIVADENGFEISGLDDGASLKVAATDTYVVNNTTINANGGDYIMGLDNGAALYGVNNDTLITGTEDADYIINSGENVTINALGGNDSISNSGDNVTIDAGTGDDLISLSGGAALVTYAEGDGNDTIYGFDSDATLSPNSTYKTQVSGNDLIVTIGDSKITLIDAANLELPNIASSSPIVQVVEAILKRTAAGYPVIAGFVFSPEEITGPEPTNYSTKEDWTITSADNLELYGVHYTPENSNDKWVVLVHGYGCNYESMNPFATFYLANNYNVLMIDQRAAGKSEGTWLTMGVAESQDVALWTQEIASRYPDSKITLHGVSMGAATALLAAARSDIKNVTSIVEDCGYSDVLKTFDTIVSSHPELVALGISSEIIPLTDPVAESLTGYYLHDAAPIDSIATVKKPTLFISGDDDGVAPVSMLHELYDESGAEVKEKFIVKGAGHARAGLNDPVGYSNAVFRFVAEANGEGWDTENIADNISLRGTKYNDTLSNTGDNVTIDSGEGDDYISNIGDTISIAGGEGNDTIYNHGDDITIDAGLGNNVISNNSDNVVFIWSGGNDTITGFKEDSILSLGSDFSTQQSGDDVIVTVGDYNIVLEGTSSLDDLNILKTGVTINNVNNDSLISGTNINDSISNYGTNVTIQALGGMDTIFNGSSNSTIDAGTGNDSISNYSPQGILLADNVSINAGAGNDTIRNEHAYNVTLVGGAGDDKIIVVTGNHTTIDGGAGNDTILGETLEGESSTWAMGGYANINGGDGDDYIDPIFSDSASIMGGEGYDTIINEGNYSTLNGGADNDIISLHGASLEGNVIKYEAGDGNDTIYGFNETSKLSITAGTEYYTDVSGDDVLVYVGENTITIVGGASLSTINITNEETQALNISNTTNNTLITGTELADTIQNSGEGVTISGKAGDDSVISSGADVSIHGGAGNDSIENSGANATILGEYGDDKLSNTADNVLLEGSYGNDTITNSGSNVTISAGTGYNYTSNTGDNVLFNFGGGLDTIYGFNETSTLSVGSADYETLDGIKNILVSAGNDIVVLKNAFLTNDSININGNTIEVEDKVIYLMPGGDDVLIGRSNVSIVSGTGDDRISLTSDASNNVIQYAQGDGNDTIYGFNDTSELSISGDYSSVKSSNNVIFKVGNDSITVVNAGSMIDDKIVLTEKGSTTLDGKVFELTENVSRGVTIASVKDGFTSGVTHSDGSIFVEKFIAKGDDSYNVQIDSEGLQTIRGIDAGTKVTSSATEDGETAENEVYIVTESTGEYTLNDIKLTTTKDNANILLYSDVLVFDAEAAEFDGKTFKGDGQAGVSVDAAIVGKDVSATGFNVGEVFGLMQEGTSTVDGQVFELTEYIPDAITIAGADGGYTFSHVITLKEATQNNVPSSYIGKTYSENVVVEGDDNYILQADSFGFRKVSGVSDGASINGGDTSIDGNHNDKYAQGGQYFYIDTDTEGDFTFGQKTYNISGDNNVEIEADFYPTYAYVRGVKNLEGTVSGNFAGDVFYINGSKNPILIYGDDSIKVVGSSSGTELLDVSDGATLASLGGVSEVHTDTEGEFWIAAEPVPFGVTVTGDDNVTFGFDDSGKLMTVDNLEGDIEFSKGTGGKLSINGTGIYVRGGEFSSIGAYDNSLYIHDIERGTISTYEPKKVWLQMRGERMTLNGNELTLTADADGIWLRDKEIVGLDEGASLQVSEGGTYLANETSLKANPGDVIIGLDGDAYIYNAQNPLITRATPTANIINHFKPKNYSVVSASATSERNISLSGGGLAVIENTSAPVNITAGDDTIVSQGENVNVSLTGGNTWLFPLDGKMILENYDHSTGTGFGTTYNDIFTAVTNGSINFNNGNLWLGSAQVTMDKNSELINFYDRVGKLQKVGYASQHDSLDASDSTNNLILVAKQNGTIAGGSGNDTIYANEGSFVDGGAGSNVVRTEGNANIVLSGRTTVENFHTGFGSGTDTIYIAGDPAGVEFLDNGLTFGNSSDTVTLSDIKTTAKVNIFHERRNVLNKGVFIAAGDWYKAENSDLAVNEGEEVYFVGTAANPKAGVDFSGITGDLNVTMDTAYIDSKDYVPTTMWVNGVYSLKGGAGNTTIIGSKQNDTILAGTGEQSINGGAGQDKMFGNTDADKNVATFFYTPGNGRDSIENFDFMSNAQDTTADKVKFNDNSAITDVFLRGDDVGIRVDGSKEFLMLEGAQGKSFRLNDDLIAKVDTNVEFDGYTNYYVGIGSKASLTVGKGAGDVEVWLSDDSLDYHGTIYDGNFAILDASQSDGNDILAGNTISNVIIGGSGNNSLWGGYSSESDTLIGGTGKNTFFYGAGNGNDNIQNAHDDDIISLEDITLDQISDANITTGGVIFKFTDGGSLTVDGTADVTYQLADGSKYSANHTTHDWDSK